MKRLIHRLSIGFTSGLILVGFQNCSDVQFVDSNSKLGSLGVCNRISCDLTPLTTKAAVTTILIALGDKHNSQLVVAGASSQLIGETVVRYSSPKENPRILVVRDANSGDEDPEDTVFAAEVLLQRYNVTAIDEPAAGLRDSDVAGYDLVWLNNPGHPMNSEVTRDTLMRFAGGVVLQGDDLSRGKTGFSVEALSGLRYIDNGTVVMCNNINYAHDNNGGSQYRVTLDPDKIPGADSSTIRFLYGNDIDLTAIARADLEVLAYAVGGPAECTEHRPAIVRYLKD